MVGSQGVEYALIRHWQNLGLLEPSPPAPRIAKAERIAVVSGSVSAVTEERIRWSCKNGFAGVRFDALAALDNTQALSDEIERTIATAVEKINSGYDPLIYTAQGPNDPIVDLVKQK